MRKIYEVGRQQPGGLLTIGCNFAMVLRSMARGHACVATSAHRRSQMIVNGQATGPNGSQSDADMHWRIPEMLVVEVDLDLWTSRGPLIICKPGLVGDRSCRPSRPMCRHFPQLTRCRQLP